MKVVSAVVFLLVCMGMMQSPEQRHRPPDPD